MPRSVLMAAIVLVIDAAYVQPSLRLDNLLVGHSVNPIARSTTGHLRPGGHCHSAIVNREEFQPLQTVPTPQQQTLRSQANLPSGAMSHPKLDFRS